MIGEKRNSMSRDILVCIFLVFLFSDAAGQQEFFGDDSGFTMGYLKGLPPGGETMHGFALGAYTSGISVSVNFAALDDHSLYSLALSYYIQSKSDASTSATIGLSVSASELIDFTRFHFGVIKCFLTESNYPFSITGLFSFSAALSSEANVYPPSIAFSYTQCLFKTGKNYPFIGVSLARQPTGDYAGSLYLPAVSVGLNLTID
jgi:hypothetical protein